MFNGYREMFLKEIITFSSCTEADTYTRVFSWAYLQMLFIKLSNTRHNKRPSA